MDDLAVPQHHRSGAHRARRHPLRGALATVLAVAAVSAALVWGLLTFDVLGVGDELIEAGVVPELVEPSVEPSAEPSVDPSAQPDPSGQPSSAEPSAEPSAGAASPAPDGDDAPVDRSLPLAVLNGTGTTGLASTAADELASEGWTVETVGNYGDRVTVTTVLYPEDAQQATAEALAADAGADEVTRSDEVDVLTLVLGPDRTG